MHGDSLQNELVAIVVPDQENAVPAAISAGILPAGTSLPGPLAPGDPTHPLVTQLSKDARFIPLLLKNLDTIGAAAKLRGFEYVKAVRVVPDQFSIENGLLTPTFKLKRQEAAKVFRPLIDAMYTELEGKRPPEAKL